MAVQNLHNNLVVGLDIGTTKICAVAGRREADRVEFISAKPVPSRGLRKGVVVDMDLTVKAIKEALKNSEKDTGSPVKKAYIGIAGGHIKGFNVYGAIAIKGRAIEENDIERLMDSVSAVYIPVDREILHVIPGGFRLDGRNGIMNPVGLCGKLLEVDAHIVTGAVASVQSLLKCCETAGVRIEDILLESLASAEAVLSEDEKKRGVILVDIGGGTTDISAYRDGVLRHTAVLTLGGNHITNDIAVGFHVSPEEAEKIKRKYGCALVRMINKERDTDITGPDAQLSASQQEYLAGIIQARCEEMIELVNKEVECISHVFPNPEIVLTGGTALLNGLSELTRDISGLPVRIGIPEEASDKNIVNSPEYATGVGLALYGLNYYNQMVLSSEGLLERMKNWARSLFNKNRKTGGVL